MNKEKKEKTESIGEPKIEFTEEVSGSILEEIKSSPEGSKGFIVIKGPNIGEKFLLDKSPITIGRSTDSDIFLDDITVSRSHASIKKTDDNINLIDKESLNGSYVNGKRVDNASLKNGDKIQIGKYIFLYFTR